MKMLSKSKNKLLQSLKIKKFRDEEKMFVAEGPKIADEILNSDYRIQWIAATSSWIKLNETRLGKNEVWEVSDDELEKISFLNHPQQVIMVLQKPDYQSLNHKPAGPVLVLDGIQDPGNLGTIIRLCDWFGIPNLIASPDTADVYNPKVIQASMGSFLRVKTYYEDLPLLIERLKIKPLYGTFMKGSNVNEIHFDPEAWIVMGNEGNGISEAVSEKITNRITIAPHSSSGAESLNVSIATAITLAAFRR